MGVGANMRRTGPFYGWPRGVQEAMDLQKKKSNIKKSANPLVVADFFVTLQANKGDFSSYPKSMRCMRHTGEATEKRFYFLYILMMCIKFPSLLHLTFISTR